MGRIRWAFTSSAANVFADWACRNPGDRDLIIPTTDEGVHPSLPSNLRDAFIAASAAQGVPLHVVLPVSLVGPSETGSGMVVTQRRLLTQGTNPSGEGALLAKDAMAGFAVLREQRTSSLAVTFIPAVPATIRGGPSG